MTMWLRVGRRGGCHTVPAERPVAERRVCYLGREMAKRRKPPVRKRPGMPRKKKVLDRITLRISEPLARSMNTACDRLDLTQREFVEAAVREYMGVPVPVPEPGAEPDPTVYRTGMWIDPAIVKMMDEREKVEAVSQRELIERAIKLKLDQDVRA